MTLNGSVFEFLYHSVPLFFPSGTKEKRYRAGLLELYYTTYTTYTTLNRLTHTGKSGSSSLPVTCHIYVYTCQKWYKWYNVLPPIDFSGINSGIRSGTSGIMGCHSSRQNTKRFIRYHNHELNTSKRRRNAKRNSKSVRRAWCIQ